MTTYTTTNTTIQTTWDGGATTWDLQGNVVNTYWDESDPAYSNAATNTISYNDVSHIVPSYT